MAAALRTGLLRAAPPPTRQAEREEGQGSDAATQEEADEAAHAAEVSAFVTAFMSLLQVRTLLPH